jgi:hypothetical protein
MGAMPQLFLRQRIYIMLSEMERLQLIVEAVNYCKRVRILDMPKSCYTKALREPVFFLWEKRPKMSKYASTLYRSTIARDLPNNGGGLVYDHAVPFRYILEQLLDLEQVNTATVRACLIQNIVTCTITKEENDLLNKAGLAHNMPINWDGKDKLSRYKAVGIEVYKQN